MPTILLQEIRDLLHSFFDWFTAQINHQTETLDVIADTTEDIKDNTDDLVTNTNPIPNIDLNIGSIKSNTDLIINIQNELVSIETDIDSLAVQIPSIVSNTSASATFAQVIATNTLNIYNKVTTISEDTTQIRADNQVIIGLLNDLLNELRGTQT